LAPLFRGRAGRRPARRRTGKLSAAVASLRSGVESMRACASPIVYL